MSRKLKQFSFDLSPPELNWIQRWKKKITDSVPLHEEYLNTSAKFKDFFKGALIQSVSIPSNQFIVVAAEPITLSGKEAHLFFIKKMGLSQMGKIMRVRLWEDYRLSDRQFEDLFLKGEDEFDYRKDIRDRNSKKQRIKRINKQWLLKPKSEKEVIPMFAQWAEQQIDLYILKIDSETVHKHIYQIEYKTGDHFMRFTNFGTPECIKLNPTSEETCTHSGWKAGWHELKGSFYNTRFYSDLRRFDFYSQLPKLQY